MHVDVRAGIVVAVAAALIIGGLIVGYSIQVGETFHKMYFLAGAAAIAGAVSGIAAWLQVRKLRREVDTVRSRLVIKDAFENEDLFSRSTFRGDDRR